MEKNTGKKVVTQGKLRENTGNFISAGMWPPCERYTVDSIITTSFGLKIEPFQNENSPFAPRQRN